MKSSGALAKKKKTTKTKKSVTVDPVVNISEDKEVIKSNILGMVWDRSVDAAFFLFENRGYLSFALATTALYYYGDMLSV